MDVSSAFSWFFLLNLQVATVSSGPAPDANGPCNPKDYRNERVFDSSIGTFLFWLISLGTATGRF